MGYALVGLLLAGFIVYIVFFRGKKLIKDDKSLW